MNKLLFALSVLFLISCGTSKKKTPEPETGASLNQRLDEYMKLNDEMKFDRIMDYIYPKLFTIAPKDQILKAMEEGFNNDEMKIELDSMKIEKMHPEFEMENGSFAKVDYSMIMVFQFLSGGDDPSENNIMVESMKEKYGKENVRYDNEKRMIRIKEKSKMVAVKDSYAKEWSFVSLNEDDPMINQLFSKDVLEKLATYH